MAICNQEAVNVCLGLPSPRAAIECGRAKLSEGEGERSAGLTGAIAASCELSLLQVWEMRSLDMLVILEETSTLLDVHTITGLTFRTATRKCGEARRDGNVD